MPVRSLKFSSKLALESKMGRGAAAPSSGPESATACVCCSWLSEAWDSEVSDAALRDAGASSWASAAGGPANIVDGSSWASRSPSVSPPVSSAPTHAYCLPEPRNVSTLMVRHRAEGQGRPRKSTGYELDTLVGRKKLEAKRSHLPGDERAGALCTRVHDARPGFTLHISRSRFGCGACCSFSVTDCDLGPASESGGDSHGRNHPHVRTIGAARGILSD